MKNYNKALNSQRLSAEINAHLNDKEKKSDLIEEFASTKPELINELHDRLNNQGRVDDIFKIINNIDEKNSVDCLLKAIDRKNRREKIFSILKVSSSIAAILVTSLVVWQFAQERDNKQQTVTKLEDASVLNPQLRLSSGTIYELITNENSATKVGVNYIVEQNSKVNINDLQQEIHGYSDTKSDNVLQLELTVPQKRSYTVVLSDGSEVILNANSSIVYPEKFAKDRREVKIKGEAFFNVKKSNIPFIVNTDKSYVKVYGTSFNVNARNANSVKTTLLNGSVGVGAINMEEQILKPNQVAIVDADHRECQIRDVDADNSIGWITGSIICLGSSLDDLIDDIEAWYGIDIRYDKYIDEVRNIKINVLIKHTMKVSDVLKLIELVTDVKFINDGDYYGIKIDK